MVQIYTVRKNIKSMIISKICNNNCIMCNSPLDEKKDISITEIKNTIKNKIDGTEDRIILNGGEPTLRNDLPLIFKEIRNQNKNIRITFLTNGRLFSNKNYLNLFKKSNIYPNYEISIMVLGPNSEIHDSITRVNGSFEQTIKGIKNLVAVNIIPHVSIVIMKQNMKFFAETIKLLSEIGVKNVQFSYVEPCKRTIPKIKTYLPELKECCDYIKKSINSKLTISLKNIPLCYSGNLETSFTLNNKKIKSKNCSECIYFNKCDGIWKEYLEIYGDKNINAIKKSI